MAKRLPAGIKECRKVLKFFLTHPDAGPFLEPVDWKAWGLDDYPTIIKRPMDLGKVQTKLAAGEYDTPADFAADVNLVWSNCMTYNVDGSDYYLLAERMQNMFQEKMAPLLEPGAFQSNDRVPTMAEKKLFSQNLYVITAEELGKVVQLLDKRCSKCIRKIDPADVEIDIDSIDPSVFWQVDQFVKDAVPERGSSKKRSAAAGDSSGAKKARP